MHILTMGYGVPGTLATVEQFVKDGGVVFDIRFSPWSANPIWRKESLVARFGAAYRHVRALGNQNYKGGPIAIVDFEAGRRLIEASAAPVTLMCACKDAHQCHRGVVARFLQESGHTTSEIEYRVVEPKPKAKKDKTDPVQPMLIEC